MTPKFDNLVSEMARGPLITARKRQQIIHYANIEHPEATYEEIADYFGLHLNTIQRIASQSGKVRHRGEKTDPRDRI